ncbi:MAG TPA: SDR family oxidoreductase [Acidimicrobiales bacterium]
MIERVPVAGQDGGMAHTHGTALVTGASRGIGRAVALELARRGFEVVATMRDPSAGADLPDAGEGRISVQRLDVTDPATIDLPDDLSVLVNNAGVECEYLPIEHAPIEQWRRVFETNVFGVAEVTRRAVPVMRRRGGGVIVNVTSSSVLVAMPFYGIYRASKAAVTAMGESLASEVGRFGIRVVEVMPGPIATDMLAGSARMPEAAAHEGYRDLAQEAYEGRMGIETMTTDPAAAARDIVDAATDPDSGLKVGCDDLGRQLISTWRVDPEALLSFG